MQESEDVVDPNETLDLTDQQASSKAPEYVEIGHIQTVPNISACAFHHANLNCSD